ncbi:MAG: EcsC family protein [Ilumatobacteraceae bacterium]
MYPTTFHQPSTQRVTRAIVAAVDKAVDAEWVNARARAATIPGRTVRDKVDNLARSFARELGTVGAVTGAVAAVPTLGTASAISAGAAELGYFTIRASELILTIAALHGHTGSTSDERRAWILSILVFGNAAAEGFTRLAAESSRRLGFAGAVRLPVTAIRSINSSMGRTIITKYGRRRAAVGLGTAMPFGIGAVVGATANYAGTKALARHAHKFFSKLPPAIAS